MWSLSWNQAICEKILSLTFWALNKYRILLYLLIYLYMHVLFPPPPFLHSCCWCCNNGACTCLNVDLTHFQLSFCLEASHQVVMLTYSAVVLTEFYSLLVVGLQTYSAGVLSLRSTQLWLWSPVEFFMAPHSHVL